jgi:hypothetical protein
MSSFDPAMVDGKVRHVLAGDGNLDQHLDDAVEKYRQAVDDFAEYLGLPFLVIVVADDFGPSLEMIGRDRPAHPEVSDSDYFDEA